MHQVVGVETVVAQVVVEHFVGREVVDGGVRRGQLFGRQAERGLAYGVALQSVAEVPHGADREDDLFPGERSGEQG